MKKDKETPIVEAEKIEVKEVVSDRPLIDIPYGKVLLYKSETEYGIIQANNLGLISILESKGFTKFESLKKK